MTDIEPPPQPTRRRVPVVGIVLGAWVVLYLLMMWHGDWPWRGAGFFDFGSPERSTMKLFGAFVPADLRWQAWFLAPLLQDALISLLFLFFFWRGVGQTLMQVVGPAWTWVVFVAGGVGAGYAHLEAHPYGAMTSAVGPFDPILCGIGLQLAWGLQHSDQRILMWRAIKTLLFLCLFMLGFALLAGMPLDSLGTERVREAMGMEGMLGALLTGVGLSFVIGLGRRMAATPITWLGRGLAIAALGGVLAAAATQAEPVIRGAERSEAGQFLTQLMRVERAVKKLTKETGAASDARNRLAVEHGRLVNHTFLEDYEGRDAFLAYAKVLGMYMKPVEDPFLVEPLLKKRYRTWYTEHEKALREQFALRERPFDPWKGL